MPSIDNRELNRFYSVQSEWGVITDFLDWLKECDIILAEFVPSAPNSRERKLAPCTTDVKDMLADYYDFDMRSIEAVKEELIKHYLSNQEWLQSGN